MKQVAGEDGQLDEAELGSPLFKQGPLPRPFSPKGRATGSTNVEQRPYGDGISTARRPTMLEDDDEVSDHEKIKAANLSPCWLRESLGELCVEDPYPVKEQNLVYDFDKTFSFFLGMAYTWRAPYWFLSMVWPQVLLAILLSVAAMYAQKLHPIAFKIEADVAKTHAFLGGILSFLIVFRSNAAYDRYYDGRKMLGLACNKCRDLVTDLYATLPIDPKDGPRAHAIAEEVRRKLNVLFALMRQNARESVAGFCPASSLRHEAFDGDTWYRDPQRPRLYDMLTDTERIVYSKYTPGSRSQACACEIKTLISQLAQMAQVPLLVLQRGHRHVEDIMTGEAAMTRIRDTPVPFPYVYIMNVLTFVFIYATPFIYNADMASKMAATSLLAAAYYGCCAIGLQLENPFGWEAVDLDLESFCMSVHDQTHAVAAFTLGTQHAHAYLPNSLRNLRRPTVVETLRRTMSQALLPSLTTPSAPTTPSNSDVQHT